MGAPQPGASPDGAPPGMMPNPAFAQWMQAKQQYDQVVAENAARTQKFEAACDLIKKDGMHGFRLDIEADSTIAPDEQAEKQARVEFMQQFVPLMQQVVPIAQGNPALAALAREVTLFAVRGFRVARPMEETIEEAFDALAQMPPQQPQGGKGGSQQNPQIEAAKVQADVHDTQLKAQTDMMAIQQKAQASQAQLAATAERTAAEQQHNQAQLALEAAKMEQSERLENARVAHLDMQNLRGLK